MAKQLDIAKKLRMLGSYTMFEDKTEMIMQEIDRKGISTIGEPLWDSESEKHIIFIDVNKIAKIQKKLGKSNLRKFQKKLTEKGLPVDFVFTEINNNKNIFELFVRFQISEWESQEIIIDSIKNDVDVDGGVILKLFSSKNIPKDFMENLQKKLQIFLEPSSLILKKIQDVFERKKIDIPPHFCLLIVRKYAPINIETIEEKIKSFEEKSKYTSFNDLNEKRLAAILDYLRQKNLILRRSDENYIMTAAGLNLLGTKIGSNSPDIKRLLEIAQISK